MSASSASKRSSEEGELAPGGGSSRAPEGIAPRVKPRQKPKKSKSDEDSLDRLFKLVSSKRNQKGKQPKLAKKAKREIFHNKNYSISAVAAAAVASGRQVEHDLAARMRNPRTLPQVLSFRRSLNMATSFILRTSSLFGELAPMSSNATSKSSSDRLGPLTGSRTSSQRNRNRRIRGPRKCSGRRKTQPEAERQEPKHCC